MDLVTTQVFRDPSAWYHIVLAVDTTQATASNRAKIYVNGSQITSFTTATYSSQNYSTGMNVASVAANIGYRLGAGEYTDGYYADFNFIDGQALTPSDFGQTDPVTGVWSPKKYLGTYGTNGFYLNFSDNSGATATTIGKDSSGNGNNWTPTNISVTAGTTYDSMIDTPTPYADGGNGRGNYATFNPLDSYLSTITNGNLTVSLGASTSAVAVSSIAVSSGKWYVEYSPNTSVSMIGVSDISKAASDRSYGGPNGWYYFGNDGTKYNNGVGQAYGASWSSANIIGVALDCDAGTVTFYKDNVSQGVAYSTLAGKTLAFGFGTGTAASGTSGSINFGQRPFTYTPPSGFKALNTQNLTSPTITKGSQYFDVVTYTGTATNLTIPTTIDPTADAMMWFKNRSGTPTGNNHYVVDSLRTYLGSKYYQALIPNATVAESATGAIVTSYTGSSITKTGNDLTNETGISYVGWLWQKGATPGFDIVTYTGNGANRTISHSLGVAPAMMIVKQRTASSTTNWAVYHKSLANTEYLLLNSTAAKATGATYWNSTSPTSSVFSLGTSADVNTNSGTYVNYLFSEVDGFSKFGSYTGNGSTDGPFVYCGFRPKYVLIKRTDSTGGWDLVDTARNPYNIAASGLGAESSGAEGTGASNSSPFMDVLSNGFKIRTTGTGCNASNGNYIYAAFAENPFKYSLAR